MKAVRVVFGGRRAPEELEDDAGVLAEHEVVEHVHEVALRRRILALQAVQDCDLHHRLLMQPARASAQDEVRALRSGVELSTVTEGSYSKHLYSYSSYS